MSIIVVAFVVGACAPAPPPATDIHPANPITFTGIGGVYPGQLATNAATFGFPVPKYGDIDYNTMCRTSAHTIYPDVSVIMDGPSKSELRIAAMYIRDPAFATSSGMRVGVTETQLRNNYGSALKVFRMNWEGGYQIAGHPVGAYYHDVAVILHEDRGITFYLDSDHKVTEIKVSKVDWLGDDEGCV